MHTQTSLEDKIDNYLFGGSSTQNDDSLSQEGFHLAYTDLAITLEQNNRLLDRVELCLYSMEQSQSISQFLSDNSLSLEKVPNWMSNAGKNVGEWFKKAWEYLKQGFLKMIKAIGGFFKRFVSAIKKKTAYIKRNGKKVRWNQEKADTRTIITKINPKVKDGNSSPFLTVYNKLIKNSQQLSEFSQTILTETKTFSFKDLIISDINNKTMGAFKEKILKFQEETTKLHDSVPALKDGAGVNQSLYGVAVPPAYEQPISNVFSQDDFLNSLQYVDRLDDEIRSVFENIQSSMKESLNIFESLIEFTHTVDKDKEDSEDATEFLKEYMSSMRTAIIRVINSVVINFNNFTKVASLCSTEALNLSILIGWILDKLILGKVEYQGPEPDFLEKITR